MNRRAPSPASRHQAREGGGTVTTNGNIEVFATPARSRQPGRAQKGFVDRDAAGDLVLTDSGRAVLRGMLPDLWCSAPSARHADQCRSARLASALYLAACHCNGSSSAPAIPVALSLVAGSGPRPLHKRELPHARSAQKPRKGIVSLAAARLVINSVGSIGHVRGLLGPKLRVFRTAGTRKDL
jgi:hypothetical protein